jgi:hypothetical protein
MKLRNRELRVNLLSSETIVCDFELAVINAEQHIVTVHLFHCIIVLIGFSLYLSSVRKIFVIVHVFSYELLEECVTK